MLWILFFIIPALIGVAVRRRYEQVLPLAVCGFVVLALPMAMAQSLKLMRWVLYGAAAAAFVWALLSARRKILRRVAQYALTPGLVCFGVLAVLHWVSSQPRFVEHVDDLLYWGIEVKSIWAYDGLVEASRHVAERFMNYTPGMQLLGWLGIAHLGEWSDSMLFFMLHITYVVFLMPFAARIRWRNVYWAPLFIVFALAAPTIMNAYTYVYLGVDTLLGLCFGYVLMQAASAEDRSAFRWMAIALGLAMMILTKMIGIVWALTAVVLLFMRERGKNSLPKLVLTLVLPAAACAGWFAFCAAKGLSGMHTGLLDSRFSAFIAQPAQTLAGLKGMVGAMMKVLLTPMVYNPGKLSYFAWLDLPQLVWMIVLCAGLWLTDRKLNKGRTALWFGLCSVLTIVAMLAGLATVFYPEVYAEGVWSSRMIQMMLCRYVSPLLMGGWMLLLCRLMQLLGKASRPRVLAVCAVAAAVCLLCFGNWQAMAHFLIPEQFENSVTENAVEDIEIENDWIYSLDTGVDRVVLYSSDEYLWKINELRYAMAPAKLVLSAAEEFSDEEFAAYLRDNCITHLVSMGEWNPVYEAAQSFAEDGWFDSYTLYTVYDDGDTISLVWE